MSTEQVLGGATGALSGAAAGAALGTKIGGALAGPVGIVGGALLGGLAGIFGSKKPKYQPIDIGKLAEQARQNAETTLANSVRLEGKYLPGQAAMRLNAENAAAKYLADISAQDYVGNLLRGAGAATQYLPEGSVAKQILSEAQMGGALTADVQSEVAKAALEGAGQAGLSGSMAGRGRVARDIGISSQALRAQRLAAALGIEQGAAQQYLAGEELRGRNILQGGIIAANTRLPDAGLSSGDLASAAIGGQNAANQMAANSAMSRNQQLMGLFGTALGAASMFGGSPTPGVAGNMSGPIAGGAYGAGGSYIPVGGGVAANTFTAPANFTGLNTASLFPPTK